MRAVSIGVRWLLILGCALAGGTLWHELVGHGLVGVALGGKIISAEVLGLQIIPEVEWTGWSGYYGQCEVVGIPNETADALVRLGGSMSTWLMSAAAVGLLWLRRWPRPLEAALVVVGLWWIDLLTYTLPAWGIRRSILWGGRISEPYLAAVDLGVPGWAFQAFVWVSCLGLAAALFIRLSHHRKPCPSAG